LGVHVHADLSALRQSAEDEGVAADEQPVSLVGYADSDAEDQSSASSSPPSPTPVQELAEQELSKPATQIQSQAQAKVDTSAAGQPDPQISNSPADTVNAPAPVDDTQAPATIHPVLSEPLATPKAAVQPPASSPARPSRTESPFGALLAAARDKSRGAAKFVPALTSPLVLAAETQPQVQPSAEASEAASDTTAPVEPSLQSLKTPAAQPVLAQQTQDLGAAAEEASPRSHSVFEMAESETQQAAATEPQAHDMATMLMDSGLGAPHQHSHADPHAIHGALNDAAGPALGMEDAPEPTATKEATQPSVLAQSPAAPLCHMPPAHHGQPPASELDAADTTLHMELAETGFRPPRFAPHTYALGVMAMAGGKWNGNRCYKLPGAADNQQQVVAKLGVSFFPPRGDCCMLMFVETFFHVIGMIWWLGLTIGQRARADCSRGPISGRWWTSVPG
jgi:hypothetical protein